MKDARDKKETEARAENSVFVDSISDGICRLTIGEDGHSFYLPSKYLPEGTKEGDYLTLTFEKDEETAGQVKKEIDGLLADLGDIFADK